MKWVNLHLIQQTSSAQTPTEDRGPASTPCPCGPASWTWRSWPWSFLEDGHLLSWLPRRFSQLLWCCLLCISWGCLAISQEPRLGPSLWAGRSVLAASASTSCDGAWLLQQTARSQRGWELTQQRTYLVLPLPFGAHPSSWSSSSPSPLLPKHSLS